MKPFNLSEWLKDKSRKVITRSGHNVCILCTDSRGNMPIVALVKFDTLDGVQIFYSDGKNESHREYDLFFADEEEELTEFEDGLFSLVSEFWQKYSLLKEEVDIAELVKENSKTLLNLARKELKKKFVLLAKEDYQTAFDLGKAETLKSLPRWKKVPSGITRKELFNMMHKSIVTTFKGYKDYYYLDNADLEKLPKEE